MDFYNKSQIYADLSKAYENVRLASSVEMGAGFNVSTEIPDKFAPQRRQPAQRPRIDVGKTSKGAAAKASALKLRSYRPGGGGDCS